MNLGRYFIDRPRFAVVLSLIVLILGGLAYRELAVTQYPEITPPTVQVTAFYPGATPETIADAVATPIEQAVNGVEGMLYMTSSSTLDGAYTLSVSFELGTDLDTAQVLVQNRVATAEPRLPEDVRRLGLVVAKSQPDIMMVIHLLSPEGDFDSLYVSNYAVLRVSDPLRRIEGVGDLIVFGAREYGMRVWLDPARLASNGLTAGDVVGALRAQNVQVSAGSLGQPPMPLDSAFQLKISTEGRFETPEQFSQAIVKSEDGRLVRVGDVARVELGAQDYAFNSYLNGETAVAIGIFQRPGSNAVKAAADLRAAMTELSEDFPPGLEYRIAYDPTVFVEESIDEVVRTLFEASLLVILVIILFLQSWRAALIPVAAIPVSLIGTFAVLRVLDFSLNNLSLFGLVLAIGVVVDDAIVVVENVERNLERGMKPKEAARVTMDEVGSALISMALVLAAVFVPTAFLGGIAGAFFQQFGLTIAVATLISAANSLTLSPALCAVLLREHDAPRSRFGKVWHGVLGPVFRGFDRGFGALQRGYTRAIARIVRLPLVALALLALFIGATALLFPRVPAGFIPQQDQGYLLVAASLPPGASLQRTDETALEATKLIRAVDGVHDVVTIVGFSGATFSAASNAAAMFVILDPFEDRGPETSATALLGPINGVLAEVRDAQFFVIAPPPVQGLGIGGGFKMMVEARGGGTLRELEAETWKLAGAANQAPEIGLAFTTFSTGQPRYDLTIDRDKAEQLDVPIEAVFETLSIQIGSAYVNDFNLFGRSYRVTAQADARDRLRPEDLLDLFARSRTGAMVPLGSLVSLEQTTGTDRVVRHNLYPTAELQGAAAPGSSSAEAIAALEALADQVLGDGYGYEWSEIAFQEKRAGSAGLWIFPLSVLFVLLLLTAQYESWSLPLAIVLIVPLCVLFALLGVWIAGMENNIVTQIGFVVLIGLACKNAILVVEFAKQKEDDEGLDPVQAAAEAASLRLRPILMTALAFILGVLPLVLSTGAGAEMRRNLGTAVFSGMIGVTFAGLFLTPAFYVAVRRWLGGARSEPDDDPGRDDPLREPTADPDDELDTAVYAPQTASGGAA